MFKKSFYNVEVDNLKDGKKLIFNTVTCALGVMDSETQHIFDSIEEADIDKIKDSKFKDSISKMQKNGFIVDKELDEIKRMEVYNKLARYSNKTTLNLIIAPTMNCNMKCPYCYEDKVDCIMTDQTQKDLISFVKNYVITKDKKFIKVIWYGGEPLLGKRIIQNLSSELIKFCDENNIKYQANIITNGTLLDKETAKMLKEEGRIENVQITIDGFKDTHNKRRILKSGEDSFGIIINNIKDNKHLFKIAIRINVDKSNIDETKELVKYLSDNDLWQNSIALYYHPVRKSRNETYSFNKSYCYEPIEFAKTDIELFKTIVSTKNKEILRRLIIPSPKYSYCGAISTDNFVIDPNGYLYTCFELCNKKKYNVGNVSQKPLLLNSNYIEWLASDLDLNCKNCVDLPICQGGCPLDRVIYNKESKCEYSVFSMKERLKLLYEVCLSDKDFLKVSNE